MPIVPVEHIMNPTFDHTRIRAAISLVDQLIKRDNKPLKIHLAPIPDHIIVRLIPVHQLQGLGTKSIEPPNTFDKLCLGQIFGEPYPAAKLTEDLYHLWT